MNLSPKVRQHSFRNPAPCKTAPRTNSLRWCKNMIKNASVFCFAAELLQSDLCSTAIQCISRKALMVLFVGRTSHDPQVGAAQKNTTQVEAPEMWPFHRGIANGSNRSIFMTVTCKMPGMHVQVQCGSMVQWCSFSLPWSSSALKHVLTLELFSCTPWWLCPAESKSLQGNRSFELSSRLSFHGSLCDFSLNVFVVACGVPGPGWSTKTQGADNRVSRGVWMILMDWKVGVKNALRMFLAWGTRRATMEPPPLTVQRMQIRWHMKVLNNSLASFFAP